MLRPTEETRRPRSKKNHQQLSSPYRLRPQREAVQAVLLASQGLKAVLSSATLAKRVLAVHSPLHEWLSVPLGPPPGGAALRLRLSGMAQNLLEVPLSGLGVVSMICFVGLPLHPRSKKNHQQRRQP